MKKNLIITFCFLITLAGCSSQPQWFQVVSTSPATDQPLVFEGEAVLEGWGVQVPYYTGEPEIHFHASSESKKDLPQDFNFAKYDYNFKLENDEKVTEFLAKSTPQYKAEIVADRITIPQEGHPLIHFKSYTQGSK